MSASRVSDDEDDYECPSVIHASGKPGYTIKYHQEHYADRTAALTRRALPPPYGCFTLPRFQLLPALEALLGLVFTNVFWVGLWDLLDNTIFPSENSVQMLSLVVGGALLLYFTNSLYEPPLTRHGQKPLKKKGGDKTKAGDKAGDKASEKDEASPRAADQLPLLRPGEDDPAYEVHDSPFVPPRFEYRRFTERVLANVGAVCIWTGMWDQVDVNLLPHMCSLNACGNCLRYGEFPCAWYKILFVVLGLAGMWFTRGLYTDREVTYARRSMPMLACDCCGFRSS